MLLCAFATRGAAIAIRIAIIFLISLVSNFIGRSVAFKILTRFYIWEFLHTDGQIGQDLCDRPHHPCVHIALITPELVAFFDIFLNVENLWKCELLKNGRVCGLRGGKVHFHVAPLEREHRVAHIGDGILSARLLLLAKQKSFLIDTVNRTIRGNTCLFADQICNRRVPVQISKDLIRDSTRGDVAGSANHGGCSHRYLHRTYSESQDVHPRQDGSAIVYSHSARPSGSPGAGTSCVPERIGSRPVCNAERVGVH